MSKPKAKSLFSPAFLIAVVCCLGVFVALKSMPTDQVLKSPALGKPAPQIDLIQLPGNGDLTSADVTLSGKVTLLHFWGTWCGPCRMEYPELAHATESLASQSKFQFVPVSCEGMSGETIEGLWAKTTEYFQGEDIHSPAFADPRGVTRQSVAERLEQQDLYYPTSILIGPDAEVAGVWEGYSESGVSEMTAMIQSMLDSR